jgi:hypothetical protein
MQRSGWLSRLAVLFLTLQGAGVIIWWLVLLLFPSIRVSFLAPGAPQSTLFAFVGADLLLYSGGSLVAAFGIARTQRWAWTALCIHAGAALYAALYGLALPIFSDVGAWLGAVMMAPSLVVLPSLLWLLRPRSDPKPEAQA